MQARSLRHLVRLLHSRLALCRALHLPSVPSAATLSRWFRRLAPSPWALCRHLSRLLDPVTTGAVDATGLRTWVRGCSRGWCGAYDHFRGLKLHAVVTSSGLLRDFAITPDNMRESHEFFPDTGLRLLVGDKGYDSERVMARYAAAGTKRFFAWLKGQPLLGTPVASVAHLTRTVLVLWLGQVLARVRPLAAHAFVW